MKRLLVLALILTACAAPASQPQVVGIEQPSLQEMQRRIDNATNTAIAAATSVAVATQARQSTEEALRDMQTATALPVMMQATQQSLAMAAATATEGAIYRATTIAATQQADERQAEREDNEATARVWILGIGALVIIAVIGWRASQIGGALKSKFDIAAIRIIDNDGAPIGYFIPTRAGQPKFISLMGGRVVEQEPVPDPELECRAAWRRAVKDVANSAARAGSWSVNAISTRNRAGGGEWSEDTVQEVVRIAAEFHALVNYSGRRGWDWADDWTYPDLVSAIDRGVMFTLPRNESGELKWPVFPEQSKAQQSKAQQAKHDDDAVATSPMKIRKEQPA